MMSRRHILVSKLNHLPHVYDGREGKFIPIMSMTIATTEKINVLSFQFRCFLLVKKSIKNINYFAKLPNKGTAFATKNIITLNPIHNP